MKITFYYDASERIWKDAKGKVLSDIQVARRLKGKGKAYVKSKSGKFYKDNKVIERFWKRFKPEEVQKKRIPDWVREYGIYFDRKVNVFKNNRGRIISEREAIRKLKPSYIPVLTKTGRWIKSRSLYRKLSCCYLYKQLQKGEIRKVYTYQENAELDNLYEQIYRLERCFSLLFSARRYYLYAEITITDREGLMEDVARVGSFMLTEGDLTEENINALIDDLMSKIAEFRDKAAGSELFIIDELIFLVFKGWDYDGKDVKPYEAC